MLEGLRGYVAMASGLTEVSRRKALDTARALAQQTPSAGDVLPRQVQQLADDLMATARSNRELLRQLVGAEVLRAADGVGLVRRHDLERLERRVDDLEHRLGEVIGSGTGRRAGGAAPAQRRPATKRTSSSTGRRRKAATATRKAATTPPQAASPTRRGRDGSAPSAPPSEGDR